LEDVFFFLLFLGLTASFRVLPSLLCPAVRAVSIGAETVLISCAGSSGLVSCLESFCLLGVDCPAHFTIVQISENLYFYLLITLHQFVYKLYEAIHTPMIMKYMKQSVIKKL